MKSVILSSTVAVSCAILASAAPATFTDSESSLAARGNTGSKVASKSTGQKIAKAAESWALNPSGQTDRDQRKKNRESAYNYVTGGGSGSATRTRHPELQKVMNANSAANAFSSKKYGKSSSSKRDVEDLEVRDYDDEELVARGNTGSKIASKVSGQKIAQAAESWALNPQGAMDRDQRKKNRESAYNYVTGGGSGSATRTRHPELQKVMNANSAANAFSSKKYGKSSSSKRDVDDLEVRDYDDEELVARASKAAGKKILQAAESWALNPQGAMDRDQRKKNRESAVNALTGGGSGSATRNRHPELQKVMNANTAANAFSSKKYGKSSSSKRDVEDLEVRDYDDEELIARGNTGSKIASKVSGQKIAKAAESWALNPQGAMDRDQRKKNRESAINAVTGGGSGSATRTRHPELQKVMNANSAANAFSSKKYGKSSSSKRDVEDLEVRGYDDELDLEARDYDELDNLD